MRRFDSAITQRGQVTLPAEVRRVLGVKPRERVTFEVEGNQVRVVPSRFPIQTVYGSVPLLPGRRDIDEQIREANEENARQIVDEMNQAPN